MSDSYCLHISIHTHGILIGIFHILAFSFCISFNMYMMIAGHTIDMYVFPIDFAGLASSGGLLVAMRWRYLDKLMPSITVSTCSMVAFFLFLLGDIPLEFVVFGLATYGVLSMYFINTIRALVNNLRRSRVREEVPAHSRIYVIDPPPSYDQVVSVDQNFDFHSIHPPPYPGLPVKDGQSDLDKY